MSVSDRLALVKAKFDSLTESMNPLMRSVEAIDLIAQYRQETDEMRRVDIVRGFPRVLRQLDPAQYERLKDSPAELIREAVERIIVPQVQSYIKLIRRDSHPLKYGSDDTSEEAFIYFLATYRAHLQSSQERMAKSAEKMATSIRSLEKMAREQPPPKPPRGNRRPKRETFGAYASRTVV